jgi:hypothetical protein
VFQTGAPVSVYDGWPFQPLRMNPVYWVALRASTSRSYARLPVCTPDWVPVRVPSRSPFRLPSRVPVRLPSRVPVRSVADAMRTTAASAPAAIADVP